MRPLAPLNILDDLKKSADIGLIPLKFEEVHCTSHPLPKKETEHQSWATLPL